MSQSNQSLERQERGAVRRIEPVAAMEPIVPVYDLSRPNDPASVAERRRCARLLSDHIAERKASGQFFILTPITNFDILPAGWQPTERVVEIDGSEGSRDVYHNASFCDSVEVALTKQGILKLWQGIGGTVRFSRRVDDRSDPFFVEWSCMIEIRQIDSIAQQYPGSKSIDLRDGSAAIRGMVYKSDDSRKPPRYKRGDPQTERINGAREHIVRLAETKALLAAMRGQLNIPSKFKRAELLTKRFLLYVPAPLFDMSNPAVAATVTAAQLGLSLYGAPEPLNASLPPQITSGERDISASFDEALDEEGESQTPRAAEPAQPAAKPKRRLPSEIVADKIDFSIATPGVPPVYVCGCPCEHQVEIPVEQYDASMDKLKSSRCQFCYPGIYFDEDLHPNKDMLLEIKAAPTWTVEKALSWKKQKIELQKQGK